MVKIIVLVYEEETTNWECFCYDGQKLGFGWLSYIKHENNIALGRWREAKLVNGPDYNDLPN